MEILYLSHCVPNPPDKGEKIRAFHELSRMAEHHRVHLVCFARQVSELEAARELEGRCASVYVEPQPRLLRLSRSLINFAAGDCLNMRFYHSRAMRRYVDALAARVPLSLALAYSAPMAQYVPPGIPSLLDMQDVDSEKWFQYSKTRWPGFVFAIEARRLRSAEVAYARRSVLTLFTTHAEELLFRSFAGDLATGFMENGVDFGHFDPAACPDDGDLAGRKYSVFIGTMDYFPNVQAAVWFVKHVFRELRRTDPSWEFFVVGRNPDRRVLALARSPGVHVTGGVADIRPYLKHAARVVTPLPIARGIQNKVLEALAMGKRVLASPAVLTTFGEKTPLGLERCDRPADYVSALLSTSAASIDEDVRESARGRFSWPENIRALLATIDMAVHQPEPRS